MLVVLRGTERETKTENSFNSFVGDCRQGTKESKLFSHLLPQYFLCSGPPSDKSGSSMFTIPLHL